MNRAAIYFFSFMPTLRHFAALLLTAATLMASHSPALSAEAASTSVVDELDAYLNSDTGRWSELGKQAFAAAPLSKSEAEVVKRTLLEVRRQQLLKERQDEMTALEIVREDKKMPFFFKTFGAKPKGSRSLFISMHGGGGAPKRVNDSQWNNQKRLYQPAEGVYVAPRAPTNTWNLWHEAHIMPMFDRMIENMILFEGVDPNRVYVMGYSAGGDGVYQLAPRMADRWAAAAMMAGHPNDAKPQNLRNIGFAIYMGGKDAAYNRNRVAAEWGEKLAALTKLDPAGYQHLTTIYPEKKHWMDGEDASSLAWMSKFTRNPFPEKIVWRKDGNRQPRFYWLGADTQQWETDETVTSELLNPKSEAQTIKLSAKPKGLSLLLCDEFIDLDQEITIAWNEGSTKIRPIRTIGSIHQSVSQRFDPTCVFTAVLNCDGLLGDE